MCGSLCRARQLRLHPLNTSGDDMKTLITDEFAERPQYQGPTVTLNANTMTMGSSITIVTTGTWTPAKPGDTPGQMDPEVYRTQAFVEKHKEITDGTER